MNMKKTMAAIAAGAVAVSAMATTVSALETKTLHYNLVRYAEMTKKGDADYTVTFPSVALLVGDTVTVNVIGFGDKDEVTIRPNYNDSTYFAPSFTYTTNKESVKFNSAINPTGTDTFPVVENNTSQKNVFVGGEMSGAKAEGVGFAVTVTSPDTLNTVATKDETLYYLTDTEINAAITTAGGLKYDNAGTAKATTGTGVSGAAAGWYTQDATALATTLVANVAKLTSDLAANTNVDTELAKIEAPVANTTVQNKYGVTMTPTGGGKLIIKAAKPAALCTIYVDVLDKEYSAKEFKDVNTDLQNGVIGVSLTVNHADGTTTPLTRGASVLNSFNGGKGVYGFPYKSSIDNTVYNQKTGGDFVGGVYATSVGEGGDVLSHIYTVETDKSSDQINPFSIRSVINDAIQQHNGNVTFVFNTAVKKVAVNNKYHADDIATSGGTWDGHWGNPAGSYVDNDWDACEVYDCTVFGNHYYNGLQYGYDANLDYYQNNWKPDNLFNGLLLVNSNLTLSLSDTEKFDWTEKSLSFTWEAIEDSALTANQYANYIQNMVLRTSTVWYWDSLDVVLADVETPGIGVGAPTDAPEQDIDEEEEEEPMEIDEPEEPEEPEEPADEPEEPAEVAPAAVSNPTTGNASVALAVIPVALAAAAIVAKKRG